MGIGTTLGKDAAELAKLVKAAKEAGHVADEATGLAIPAHIAAERKAAAAAAAAKPDPVAHAAKTGELPSGTATAREGVQVPQKTVAELRGTHTPQGAGGGKPPAPPAPPAAHPDAPRSGGSEGVPARHEPSLEHDPLTVPHAPKGQKLDEMRLAHELGEKTAKRETRSRLMTAVGGGVLGLGIIGGGMYATGIGGNFIEAFKAKQIASKEAAKRTGQTQGQLAQAASVAASSYDADGVDQPNTTSVVTDPNPAKVGLDDLADTSRRAAAIKAKQAGFTAEQTACVISAAEDATTRAHEKFPVTTDPSVAQSYVAKAQSIARSAFKACAVEGNIPETKMAAVAPAFTGTSPEVKTVTEIQLTRQMNIPGLDYNKN